MTGDLHRGSCPPCPLCFQDWCRGQADFQGSPSSSACGEVHSHLGLWDGAWVWWRWASRNLSLMCSGFLTNVKKSSRLKLGIIGVYLFVAEFRSSKTGKHKSGHCWSFHWSRWHNFQSLEEGLIFTDFLPWSPKEILTSHLALLSGK